MKDAEQSRLDRHVRDIAEVATAKADADSVPTGFVILCFKGPALSYEARGDHDQVTAAVHMLLDRLVKS